MKTKLTLTVDRDRLKRAKRAVRLRKRSLSSLVNDYLADLGAKEPEKTMPFSEKWAHVLGAMADGFSVSAAKGDSPLSRQVRKTEAFKRASRKGK